jgi:hypothetical protein
MTSALYADMSSYAVWSENNHNQYYNTGNYEWPKMGVKVWYNQFLYDQCEKEWVKGGYLAQ